MQDVSAERAVLAGLCRYGSQAYIDVSDLISTNSFSIEDNQLLYKCIEAVINTEKEIDIASIIIESHNLGVYDRIAKSKGSVDFIQSLFSFPIKLENVRLYAKKLAKLEIAKLSQAKHKEAFETLSQISGNESIDSILAISENVIFDLISEINRDNNDGPQLISKNSDEILQNLIENPMEMVGLPTPWKYYNNAIGGGLRRGGVNLIASRPKRGKSTLGKESALHFPIACNSPVLYLDTEMVSTDQLFRALSSLSGVELEKIETGKFGQNSTTKNLVLEANEKLKQIRFYHEKIAGKPFEEVLSIIRRWILKEVGYDDNGKVNDCIVIYDYFKLMDDSKLKDMLEYQAIGFQISRLSDFCKEYDFACLAFAQLNRDGATKDSSEVISQSDRLLWLCHSFAIFRDKTPDEILEDGRENGNRRLKVMDCRFGPGMNDNDYINMQLYGDINKIVELGTKATQNANKNKLQVQGFEIIDDKTDTGEIAKTIF